MYRLTSGSHRLALLITVLQGASIWPLLQAIPRVLRLTKDSKRHSLPTPRLLNRAVLVLGVLLTLSTLTSIFDTLMHASSEAVPLTQTFPYTGQALFGKQLSENPCTPSTTSSGTSLCGAAPEGFRTLSNSSTSNRVVFTDDQHAIIVPATLPSKLNITYEAATVGLKATCQR